MVAGDDMPPAAVVLVLLGEGAHGGAGPVRHLQLGREPDQPARLADPEIQLPVLGADELDVVAALPLQRLAPEDAEVDGLGLARPATGVEDGVADADLRRHRGGDRVLPVVLALGVHDAAHVLRAGLLQEPHGGGDVVRREHAVTVDPDHDRVAGRLDRGVERGGRTAGGVRDRVDAGVLGDELGRDLVRTVRGRTEGDHDLHLAGVLLREDRLDCSAQMPLLVEDGHDDGHGGELHVGIGVHRGLTLPRTGDTGAPRPGRCPGPQIVWAYGAQDPTYGPRGGVPHAHAAPLPRQTSATTPPAPRPAEEATLGHAGGDHAVGGGAGVRRDRARGADRPGRGHRAGRPVQGHEEPAAGRARDERAAGRHGRTGPCLL